MPVATIVDPAEFLERAGGLIEDEARHNLMRGVVRTLVHSPNVFPDYRLFIVERDGRAITAASITAPFSLLVSDTDDDTALRDLVTAVRADGVPVPGVTGNRPTVDRFATLWQEASGGTSTVNMEQGVFALHEVRPVPRPSGVALPAVTADVELMVRWIIDFMTEAVPFESTDLEQRARRSAERRVSGDADSGAWLWEVDGVRVGLSGYGHPTGTGIRIGMVYTPPEHRGNGYATALVADQSQWLLDNGYDVCFLLTDLANPTSNRIYERIGYRQVAEAASYGFD